MWIPFKFITTWKTSIVEFITIEQGEKKDQLLYTQSAIIRTAIAITFTVFGEIFGKFARGTLHLLVVTTLDTCRSRFR